MLEKSFQTKKNCPDSSILQDFMNKYESATSALVDFFRTPCTGIGRPNKILKCTNEFLIQKLLNSQTFKKIGDGQENAGWIHMEYPNY